ncbi:MAG: hypothetical protein JW954_01540, partial [Dehalococcoidaceae bacterium]|nr:hypothetical protein [Dehalococcoidaceae bacterium]
MKALPDRRILKCNRWLWLLTSLSLCLFLVFSGVISALALSPFIKTTQEVELGNLRGVTDSWVIKDGSTYKMWFTHPKTEVTQSQVAGLVSGLDLDAILDALQGQDVPALLQHLSGLDPATVYNLLRDTATVIGYATSTDGINWTMENSEVLTAPAENELQSVAGPCVIYNDISEEYEMWYSRSTTEFSEAEIAQLLSDLGSTDDQDVANAIVDIIDGNQVVIDYATSSDGINWTVAMSVLQSGGTYLGDNLGAPCVLFDGTDYTMWFSSVSTGINDADIEDLVANMESLAPEDLWDLQNNLLGSIGYAESSDGTTWTSVDYDIFSKGAGMLNAVTAPCVITDGVEYQMWYTYGVTDFTLDDISPILEELSAIDIDYLLELLEAEDYDTLIEEFVEIIDNDLTETKTRLEGTTARIGYASSATGTSGWSENNAYGLNPASDTPWASVARPCVIRTGEFYQMWFTRGIDELTAQNLVDLWQGTISTIGYASTGVNLELVAGWNFIGLPLDPVPPDTSDVFNSIIGNVQTVWAYDAATGLW